jgi:hypothetical protein
MRPNKLRRKLILNAETLRRLDDGQLAGVAGGVAGVGGSNMLTCPTLDHRKCPTNDQADCPSWIATECPKQC